MSNDTTDTDSTTESTLQAVRGRLEDAFEPYVPQPYNDVEQQVLEGEQ